MDRRALVAAAFAALFPVAWLFGAWAGVAAAGALLAGVWASRVWRARRHPGDVERWYGERASDAARSDAFSRSASRASAVRREEEEGVAAEAAHERRWARLLPFAIAAVASAFLWTPARAVGHGATFALAAVGATLIVGALIVARSTRA